MPNLLINYLSAVYKFRIQNQSVQKIDRTVYFLDTYLKEIFYVQSPAGHPYILLPAPFGWRIVSVMLFRTKAIHRIFAGGLVYLHADYR